MLYFIRHGQTNHNANKLLAGRCDIELNEVGLEQAKIASDNCRGLNIDLIYCSPLIRAKQTCDEINKNHDCKVIIKDELIERSFGKYESKPYGCVEGKKCWNYYDNTYDNEVEPLRDVFKRVHSFLDEIKEECKNGNVLIVAHNDVGRAIHCYFNGIVNKGDLLELSMPNASVVEYEWRTK